MPARLVAINRAAVQTGGPYDDYLVYDTFTDDDDVTLNNHTPEKDTVGNGWSATANKISNNQAYYATVGKGSVIDAGQADVDITVIFNKEGVSPSQQGFCFRVSADDSTYLFIRLIALNTMYLDKEDMSNITTSNIVWDGDIGTLRIVIDGNSIKIYWDDVLEIDVSESHAAGGTKLGFWSWGGSQLADNLMVTMVGA